MENKAGLNVNEEIQVQVRICARLYEMSLWRPALWQSSFDLLEASISAKRFQMERKIVLLGGFFNQNADVSFSGELFSLCATMPGLSGGMRTWEQVHASTRLMGHGFDVAPAQVQN